MTSTLARIDRHYAFDIDYDQAKAEAAAVSDIHRVSKIRSATLVFDGDDRLTDAFVSIEAISAQGLSHTMLMQFGSSTHPSISPLSTLPPEVAALAAPVTP